jgi:hypothetical protein
MTPQNQNSKDIFEIPIIILTCRGGLGTFLSIFQKSSFFGRENCAIWGMVRSGPRNPFNLSGG